MDILQGFIQLQRLGKHSKQRVSAMLGSSRTRIIEMDGEESIYSLIPKEYVPPPKPKRYRSKFPPETTPTASTFA